MKRKLMVLVLSTAGLLLLGANTIFHPSVSSAQTVSTEITDQMAIEDIHFYLTTDYIQMHDEKKDVDFLAQLEKLNTLEKALAKSEDRLSPEVKLAAQTMITQLKIAMYHDKPYAADYYVDQYLRLLYSSSSASGQSDALQSYSGFAEAELLQAPKDWQQFTENEKISFILATKNLVLSQEALQYAPSTFYLYEQLEKQSVDGNVTNKLVQLLFS